MRWAVLLVAVTLTACSAAQPWLPLPLPDESQPVALVATADRLVVGTQTDTGAPGLAAVDATGHPTPIPVTPRSPYGREARWTALAASGDQLAGVAGVRGGAHGNVRWTVWRGDRSGVEEEPQPFETFGGWGAGSLTGIAFDRAGPVIVGSWASRTAGLEPTLWRPDGTTWARHSLAGTPLANSEQVLNQVTGIATRDGTLVLAGSSTTLGTVPAVRPLVWLASQTGWESVVLPAPLGTRAEAVGCDQTRCLVLGRHGAALQAWVVDSSGAQPVDLSPAPLTQDRLQAPVVTADRLVAVIPTATGALLIEATSSATSTASGPPGTADGFAVSQGQSWVIGSDGGVGRLWMLSR